VCLSKTSEENFHLPLDDNELAYKELHLFSMKSFLLFGHTFPSFLAIDCTSNSIEKVLKPEQNIH